MLLLFFCLLQVVRIEMCVYCCKCGDLTPDNPYMLLNDILELTCQLDEKSLQQGLDSSKLFFAYGKESKKMERKYISFPDNRTAVLKKQLTSAEDAVSYSCEIEGRSESDRIVGSQRVHVEYPVHPVENFRCQLFDWDKNMTCWWDLGLYINTENINVSLEGSNGGQHVCPQISNTKCEYPDPATGNDPPIITDVSHWKFAVVVKNTMLQTKNLTFYDIETKDMVKPAKVLDFSAERMTHTTVDLVWTMGMRRRDQIFKIRYWSVKWNTSHEFLTENKATSARISGLIPDTVYHISIQIRPYYNNTQTGYWSDSVNITCRTHPDVPNMPPTLYMGSFERNAELCTEENGFHTNVSIFWKAIPEKDRNGIISHYRVSYQEEDNPVPISINITTLGVLSTTVELKCRKSYSVSIRAGTAAGLSASSSPIIIPAVTDLESPAGVLVEVDEISGKGVVNITWSRDPDENIRQYTVYWCNGNCLNNQINWRHVPINSPWLSLAEEELGDISTLRFAVSADTAEFSSGFKWHACVYKKNTAPRPPLNINILSSLNGLKVHWSRPDCDGYSAYPAYYKITWCPSPKQSNKCEGMMREHFIPDDDIFMYTIADVQIGIHYGIRVYSVSSNNVSSQDREMVYGKAHTDDRSGGAIAGIVCGSLFGFILLLSVIVYCVRHVYRYSVKMTTPVPIELPTFPEKLGRDDESSSNLNYLGICPNGDNTLPSKPDNGNIMNRNLKTKLIHQGSIDSGRGSLEKEIKLSSPQHVPVISQANNTEFLHPHNDIPAGYAKVSLQSPSHDGVQKLTPQEVIINHVTSSQIPFSTGKPFSGSGSHMTTSSSDLSGVASYQSVVQKSSSECSTDLSLYSHLKGMGQTTLNTVSEYDEDGSASVSEGGSSGEQTEGSYSSESADWKQGAESITPVTDTCQTATKTNVNAAVTSLAQTEDKDIQKNMDVGSTGPLAPGSCQCIPLPHSLGMENSMPISSTYTSDYLKHPMAVNSDNYVPASSGMITLPNFFCSGTSQSSAFGSILVPNGLEPHNHEPHNHDQRVLRHSVASQGSSSNNISVASSSDLSQTDACSDKNKTIASIVGVNFQIPSQCDPEIKESTANTESDVPSEDLININEKNKTPLQLPLFGEVIALDNSYNSDYEGCDTSTDISVTDDYIDDLTNNNSDPDLTSSNYVSSVYTSNYTTGPLKIPYGQSSC